MKRFHLFTLLFCAFFTGATAQTKEFFKEKKHELRLSYGSVNEESYYDNFHFNYYNSYNYYGFGGYNYGWYYGNENYQSASIYQGPTKTTGVFNGSYLYNMSNIRFSFGGTLSYSIYNTDFYNRLDDTKAGYLKGQNIAFTPTIRYSWISKEKFRLYSGIGWSFYWDISNYKINTNNGTNGFEYNRTVFANTPMITPLGFSFGKELFVFGEGNLGGRTGNFVGGIGYRF